MYVPSPFTSRFPLQRGVPEQAILPWAANGPQSTARTVAGSAPRPLTVTWSTIDEPGRVFCALTRVTTFGWETTMLVSAVSAHGVWTARTKPCAAIDSRYT